MQHNGRARRAKRAAPEPANQPSWQVPSIPVAQLRRRRMLARIIPSVIFGLALGTFVLPFTRDLFTRTGQQAVTHGLSLLSLDLQNKILLCLVATLCGLFSGLIVRRSGMIVPFLAGIGGIGALYWYRSQVAMHVRLMGGGQVSVDYEPGFWALIALLGLGSLVSLGLIVWEQRRH